MTASTQDYLLTTGLLYPPRWSDAFHQITVPAMDDEAAREDFRTNLGMTLYRVRRKATSYTQHTIAAELGVDRETYGRWERGLQEPRVFDLARIWRAFGVPAEWLLDPSGSPTVIDRRIAGLKRERQTQAALEVARAEEGEGPAPSDDAVSAARRGRRSE